MWKPWSFTFSQTKTTNAKAGTRINAWGQSAFRNILYPAITVYPWKHFDNRIRFVDDRVL